MRCTYHLTIKRKSAFYKKIYLPIITLSYIHFKGNNVIYYITKSVNFIKFFYTYNILILIFKDGLPILHECIIYF